MSGLKRSWSTTSKSVPLGVDSLEFDDEGVMEISFVTIRPGTFSLQVPGTTSESQKAVFNVK